MAGGMFDSSILIDCLRGRADAIAFLTRKAVASRSRTHLLVAAELLTGARRPMCSGAYDSEYLDG